MLKEIQPLVTEIPNLQLSNVQIRHKRQLHIYFKSYLFYPGKGFAEYVCSLQTIPCFIFTQSHIFTVGSVQYTLTSLAAGRWTDPLQGVPCLRAFFSLIHFPQPNCLIQSWNQEDLGQDCRLFKHVM